MKSFIRNLLIGNRRIASRNEYKYAMLRGEFGLLITFVAVFYIVLDIFNGMYVFLPLYGVLIFFSTLAIWLNRTERYNFASLVILTLINGIIFVFADVDHPQGGVYFFFITSSITGLILTNYYPSRLGLAVAFLPLALGYVAYLADFELTPHPSQDPIISRINFLANFTMGVGTCIFVVQFLINRNRESERSMDIIQKRITKTSEDLARSEERFALALKGTRAGIYEWDVQKNKVYVSDYYKSLLGMDEGESASYSAEAFLSRVHPEDLARTSQSVTFHLNTQQPYQNELRIKMKDGTYKWFLDSGIFKSDERGAAKMVIGSIIDIEERKQSEQKILQQNELLAKANKELDYFVYSVSHDLRAPLSSILGLTNIYRMAGSQEEKESIVTMINERAQVLDSFIREVLDYSRNARVDIKRTKFKVRNVVTEVTRGLDHMQGIHDVEIAADIAENHELETDQERIRVILNNLISNAINYRDPSKKSYVRINSVLEDGHWMLSVSDNGIGIRSEHVPRIFEMFYKAHDHGQGTGLGLYIVRETLQKLGGEVTVESEYGVGSTFTISLQA